MPDAPAPAPYTFSSNAEKEAFDAWKQNRARIRRNLRMVPESKWSEEMKETAERVGGLGGAAFDTPDNWAKSEGFADYDEKQKEQEARRKAEEEAEERDKAGIAPNLGPGGASGPGGPGMPGFPGGNNPGNPNDAPGNPSRTSTGPGIFPNGDQLPTGVDLGNNGSDPVPFPDAANNGVNNGTNGYNGYFNGTNGYPTYATPGSSTPGAPGTTGDGSGLGQDPLVGALGDQYQDAFDRATENNLARERDIVAGYQQLLEADQSRLEGLRGEVDLLAQQEREDIDNSFLRQRASAEQDLIGRGLANSTIRLAADRGIEESRQDSQGRLEDRLNRQRLDYTQQGIQNQTQIGQNLINFLSQRTDTYPSISDYVALAQAYGAGGAAGGLNGTAGTNPGPIDPNTGQPYVQGQPYANGTPAPGSNQPGAPAPAPGTPGTVAGPVVGHGATSANGGVELQRQAYMARNPGATEDDFLAYFRSRPGGVNDPNAPTAPVSPSQDAANNLPPSQVSPPYDGTFGGNVFSGYFGDAHDGDQSVYSPALSSDQPYQGGVGRVGNVDLRNARFGAGSGSGDLLSQWQQQMQRTDATGNPGYEQVEMYPPSGGYGDGVTPGWNPNGDDGRFATTGTREVIAGMYPGGISEATLRADDQAAARAAGMITTAEYHGPTSYEQEAAKSYSQNDGPLGQGAYTPGWGGGPAMNQYGSMTYTQQPQTQTSSFAPPTPQQQQQANQYQKLNPGVAINF